MARIKSSQPFTALPNWIFEKQKTEPGWLSCQELSVLMSLQHFACGIGHGEDVFPSQKTISLCAGISKSTTIRCITSLVDKKLVEKIARFDEFGQKTNLYRLTIWDGLDRMGTLPEPSDPVPERHPPVVTVTPPPCQSDTRTRTNKQKNPPIPPLAADTLPTARDQQWTTSPVGAPGSRLDELNGTPTPRSGWNGLPGAHGSELPVQGSLSPDSPRVIARSSDRHVASAPMVPDDLRPVANMICTFFNNHKGGSKTKKAFDGLITNLQRILKDEHGGIKEVESQLREAIDRSVSGEKKWESIRFSNWEKYGKKQQPAWAVNNRPSTVSIQNAFEEDHAIFF